MWHVPLRLLEMVHLETFGDTINVKIDSTRTLSFLFTQFNILWILKLIEFVDIRVILVVVDVHATIDSYLVIGYCL